MFQHTKHRDTPCMASSYNYYTLHNHKSASILLECSSTGAILQFQQLRGDTMYVDIWLAKFSRAVDYIAGGGGGG